MFSRLRYPAYPGIRSWIFLISPRSASTRSRMSGMCVPPDVLLRTHFFASRSISTFSWYSHGVLEPSSPQGDRRPLAVDHLARVPVDEDEHLLRALVPVPHEPDGRVQQLSGGLLEVRHEGLQGIDPLPSLLLRVLLGEALRELIRLLLRDVAVEGLDAAGLLLVVRRLALDIERVSVVRLVLVVPAHADDRDLIEHVDSVAHADGLRLVHLDVPAALVCGGRCSSAGEDGEPDLQAGLRRPLARVQVRDPPAFEALDVRGHARRDDPVGHESKGRLEELCVLRDVPPEQPLVEPLSSGLQGRLLVNPVVEHEVLLNDGPSAGTEGRRGPAIVARDQCESSLRFQWRPAGGALEVRRARRGVRGRVRGRWGLLGRVPGRGRGRVSGGRRCTRVARRRSRAARPYALLPAAAVAEHGSIWNLLPAFLAEHENPLGTSDAGRVYLRIPRSVSLLRIPLAPGSEFLKADPP